MQQQEQTATAIVASKTKGTATVYSHPRHVGSVVVDRIFYLFDFDQHAAVVAHEALGHRAVGTRARVRDEVHLPGVVVELNLWNAFREKQNVADGETCGPRAIR